MTIADSVRSQFADILECWNDETIPPTTAEVSWLCDMVSQHYPKDLPTPKVFPGVNGEIGFEWRVGGDYCSLVIDLENRTATAFRFNANDVPFHVKFEARDLDMSQGESWEQLRILLHQEDKS